MVTFLSQNGKKKVLDRPDLLEKKDLGDDKLTYF